MKTIDPRQAWRRCGVLVVSAGLALTVLSGCKDSADTDAPSTDSRAAHADAKTDTAGDAKSSTSKDAGEATVTVTATTTPEAVTTTETTTASPTTTVTASDIIETTTTITTPLVTDPSQPGFEETLLDMRHTCSFKGVKPRVYSGSIPCDEVEGVLGKAYGALTKNLSTQKPYKFVYHGWLCTSPRLKTGESIQPLIRCANADNAVIDLPVQR